MSSVLILGNGLSIGFDPRLDSEEIWSRVKDSLGGEYVSILDQLAELASPEVDAPIAIDRGNFERLVGPLDRLADALQAVEGLLRESKDAQVLRALREASDELRRHYFKAVGTVLREVDRCCVAEGEEVTDERREAWEKMNSFAKALVKWDAGGRRLALFTLNYDSLLKSALLNNSTWVYDGFRGNYVNVPLDRWSEPALYQLHGSVSWIRTSEGIESRALREMRAQGVIERWADGQLDRGLPMVVLGDVKTRATQRFPFVLMYEELRRCLSDATLVVVGGYSFGDSPVNQALAEYLAKSEDSRLLIWHPTEGKEAFVDRLTARLQGTDDRFDPSQIDVEIVWLPDSSAVDEARRRSSR